MLTVTDIFAGAGGSSTGMAQVPGVQVEIAANHWQLAVDVHQANHEATEHACVDLHMEDPRKFPKTEVLWASPECTKWSIASGKSRALTRELGGDPTLFDDVPEDLESCGEDEISRSRLLMFDVLRFVEHHRYRAVIVENVVDIATQPKYCAAWQAWQAGLRKLGYQYRVLSLNSMHAQAHGLPAPQSRDRLYVVAWPEHEPAPDLDSIQQPEAWCPRCAARVRSRQAWKPGRTVGRYRTQYVYTCPDCGTTIEPGWLPASTAIDWSIPGTRIGDRDKPLSEKTMNRIREGLRRYGREILVVNHVSGSDASRSRPARVEGRDGKTASPATSPLRTQTTRNELALLVPYYSASQSAKPVTEPIGTLTTVDRYALIESPSIDPDDCFFRMLEPHEIAAGMSFPLDYIWQGSKRDRVKLAGNAVTPPAARDILTAVADSIRRTQ